MENLKKENKIIKKQKLKLEKKENKLLNKKENTYLNKKISPIAGKINKKIPPKLMETLRVAFEKGFYFVFEKGRGIIEKGYDAERLKTEFDMKEYTWEKNCNRKALKEIDKKAKSGTLINKGIGGIEGAVLGILGIGLPDIPVLIAMLLKNIYEVCLNYGFTYESEEERIYILSIICMAATKGEGKKLYSDFVDEIGECIDKKEQLEIEQDEMIKKAAGALSSRLVGAKFVQGLPLVGVVGGITNYVIMQDVSQVAMLKYKKRFLNKI